MRLGATIVWALTLAGLAVASPVQANDSERAWLDAHNAERAEFGVLPLSWSEELESEARAWAEGLARDEIMRHSSYDERGGKGENLWMGTAGFYTAEQMIGHFAEEKQYFYQGRFPEVSTTGDWGDVGHYTQMVWPGTREVGCALARGVNYDFLVCRYYPSGNRMGQQIMPGRLVNARGEPGTTGRTGRPRVSQTRQLGG